MKGSIRILVAEDHPLARMGVRTMINTQSDMKVVAEASNGREAVALFRKHLPDVTLLDLLMPEMGGAEAASAIRAEYASARMIALSTYAREYDIRRALAAGMRGYLTKDTALQELLEAVRIVHAGGTYLPRALAAMLTELAKPDLSPREFQVLELVARGRSNKQIAYELQIAEHTTKNHVNNILAKMGAQDRTEAVWMAIQRGIIHA
jgi:two-component system NarL family response regulator